MSDEPMYFVLGKQVSKTKYDNAGNNIFKIVLKKDTMSICEQIKQGKILASDVDIQTATICQQLKNAELQVAKNTQLMIIGIVGGTTVLLVLIFFIIYYFNNKQKNQ